MFWNSEVKLVSVLLAESSRLNSTFRSAMLSLPVFPRSAASVARPLLSRSRDGCQGGSTRCDHPVTWIIGVICVIPSGGDGADGAAAAGEEVADASPAPAVTGWRSVERWQGL